MMAVPVIGQVVSAVYTALSGNGTLTGLLGTYSSATCIFEGKQVPSAAPAPYVSIRPFELAQTFDTKNYNGLELDLQIACYTDERETSIVLEQICDQVITTLHRQLLSMTDTNVFLEYTGSILAPTDDNISGQILTFKFIIV